MSVFKIYLKNDPETSFGFDVVAGEKDVNLASVFLLHETPSLEDQDRSCMYPENKIPLVRWLGEWLEEAGV